MLDRQIDWWKQALAGAATVLELPTDHPRPPVQSFRGGTRTLAFSASLTAALHGLGRVQGATLFMTLLAGFDVLLHRYTGQEDILVGSPIANRPRAELEPLIGLFVNTLVLRGRFGPEAPSFRELLGRVRSNALDAYAHQDLPFERLVEELRVERSLARTPLHQAVFALQNNPASAVALSGLTFEPLGIGAAGGGGTATAKTDLLLALTEQDGGHAGEHSELAGAWEYSADLFDDPTIERLSGHLRILLEAAAANPDLPADDLPMLSGTERRQLLELWNDTLRPAAGACLHHLFEAWVEKTPDATAAVFEEKSLTYAELDARAARLARRLHGLGAGPETLVAICEPESLDRLAAVIATFKAGAAYLPLDPTHPAERLAFLLEDSGASILLTRRDLLAGLPETAARLVLLDDPEEAASPDLSIPAPSSPDHLAYVIYTSGSTGRPNGVQVPHRAASHLIVQAAEHFRVGPESRVLQSVSFSFDASVLETWMTLASGAALCIAPREARMSGEVLAGMIRRERITTAVLTPAGLGGLPVDGVPSLRVVSVGGDRCPAELANRWAPPASGLDRLLNCYGPTETTIYATVAVCGGGTGRYRKEPPIGQPVGNMRAFVLDGRGNLQPVGVPGELFLGGDGVTRGYLARPALTAERFVPDPFGTSAGTADPGSRLYRTGDLVRRLPGGGVLEFLGRVDGQVKVRGLRIEVGEVEAALGSHPSVAECAVLVQTLHGESLLVACVVPRKTGLPSSSGTPDVVKELREHLRTRLPESMVPGRFLLLESLPLSPTGKIDRRALEAIELEPASDLDRIEPRDIVELELARIWESVLGFPRLNTPRLGMRDNFFDAGGHSLLAVRLVEQVRQRFGRELPLAVLFQGGTVEAMAALLRGEESDAAVSSLVPIQPLREDAEGNSPFFCVHPAGGDVLAFALLARHLGPDQPFYGLQSQGLAGAAEPLDRIEDMAALYLEEIRRVQPAGPYRLGGWSLGALIAFEMANQLKAAGEDVALLAVLDSSPEMANVADTGPAGQDEDREGHLLALLEIGQYVERLFGKPVGLTREDLEGLDAEAGLDVLLERLRRTDFLPPGAGAAQLRRVLKVYQANTLAVRRYVPGRYLGQVTLFRAAARPDEGAPDMGWGQVSAEPVAVYAVAGDHITMLAEPNVQDLARQLRTALETVPAEVSRLA